MKRKNPEWLYEPEGKYWLHSHCPQLGVYINTRGGRCTKCGKKVPGHLSRMRMPTKAHIGIPKSSQSRLLHSGLKRPIGSPSGRPKGLICP